MKPVSYFIETRGSVCEYCHSRIATDRHHALEHRQKRYPELDNEINISFVCHACHMSGILDTSDYALSFAVMQIKRGYNLLAWYDLLPLKVKRFPNLRNELGYCNL